MREGGLGFTAQPDATRPDPDKRGWMDIIIISYLLLFIIYIIICTPLSEHWLTVWIMFSVSVRQLNTHKASHPAVVIETAENPPRSIISHPFLSSCLYLSLFLFSHRSLCRNVSCLSGKNKKWWHQWRSAVYSFLEENQIECISFCPWNKATIKQTWSFQWFSV